MDWIIYICKTKWCSNKGGRWPVAENDESIEALCPECEEPGTIRDRIEAPVSPPKRKRVVKKGKLPPSRRKA